MNNKVLFYSIVFLLGLGAGFFVYSKFITYDHSNSSYKEVRLKSKKGELEITKEHKVSLLETSPKEDKPKNSPFKAQTHESSKREYRNSFFRIVLLPEWKVSSESGKKGSVSFTKEGYIFYVNPNYSQTSGVLGGSFADIASGAPGVDLVSRFNPPSECIREEGAVVNGFKEVHVITGPGVDSKMCGSPKDGKFHWYFTFYAKDGYLTYIDKDQNKSLVITLTYKTDEVEKLPSWNSNDLKEKISEVREMVKSLEVLK